MKPRTPGFWLIVATVGLLALLPMKALAGMTPAEVKMFEEAKAKAEVGDPQSQSSLGGFYAIGRGVPPDKKEALIWYRKAADQGYALAKTRVGYCFEYGQGVAKDEVEAVKWYRQAAEQGETGAMRKMGLCLKNGIGVAKDEVESVKWFRKLSELTVNVDRKAAEAGSAHAQYQMGIYYLNGGLSGTKDYVEAVKWFRIAAGREGNPDQVDVWAKYQLGFMYEKGQGVAVDLVESVRWWRRAAELGHAGARFSMGYCYQVGQGVPKDVVEAVKWFRLSAEQGNKEAQIRLAQAYYSGMGVPKDTVEALAYASLVAKVLDEKMSPEDRPKIAQRTEEIRKLIKIHVRYLGHEARSPESVRVFEDFKRSAENGDSNAQNYLAWKYQDGELVIKDEFEAAKWLRKSAAQGNARAAENLERALRPAKEAAEFKAFMATADQTDAATQNRLGLYYLNGKGVKRDFAIAATWFRKAADQGHANAQYNLGTCYSSGWGVTENQAEAISWFRKGAEKGDAQAQHELGVCYQVGIGMPKDQVQADIWLDKAAKQDVAANRKAAEEGDPVAQHKLGDSYRHGKGVTKDYVEAVKWYRKSAAQGNVRAQFMMGNSYLYGEGMAKDKVEAIAYWELASPHDLSARQSLGFLSFETLPLTGWQGEKRARELQKEIEANMAAKKADSTLSSPAQISTGIKPAEISAFEQTRAKAVKGNLADLLNLGFYYATGTGVAKNEAEAVAWFRKAAEQWFVPAQFQMGLCYANGAGVTKDEIEAFAYWNLIKENYPLAQSHLASLEMKMAPEARTRGRKRAEELIHENESKQVGKPWNYADEYRLFKRERLKNPRNLRVMLEANLELLVGFYMQRLKHDDQGGLREELQVVIKTFDFIGDDDAKRLQSAVNSMHRIYANFKKSSVKEMYVGSKTEFEDSLLKAEKGDAAAQFLVGKGYMTHEQRDYKNALKWLLKSAEQGHLQAQTELGTCNQLFAGSSGSPVREQAAIESAKWYRVAAERGHAKAQYSLGDCYFNGRGVAKDEVEAVKWLRLSAAQGYVPAQVDLWRKLSHTYSHGGTITLKLKQEALESLMWSRKLAERGDINAMNEQADAYHNGEYVPKDEVAALKWRRMAAEAGDEKMQGELWSLYSTGKASSYDPVPIDEVEAMKWCRILAADGNANALNSIGACYAEGRGLPQSDIEAYAYWTAVIMRWGDDPRAASQPEPLKRRELREKMSAADRAAGQKRAGEILTDLHVKSMKNEALFNARQNQRSLDYK
jgi:TPR repeat protein